MKILLFGGTGLIGSAVAHIFRQNKVEVVMPTHRECDVLNPTQILDALKKNTPDFVINATGYTAVDRAETEVDEQKKCRDLNVEAPRILAQESAKMNTPFIQISTDYVFDGTAVSPLNEASAKNPLNFYGRTKSEGEDVVLGISEKNAVIRTAWPFGPGGKNFVDTILKLAAEKEVFEIVNDQTGSPTYTLDFAEALLSLLTNYQGGIYHVVNSSGNAAASWYSLAKEAFDILGVPRKILPISTEQSNRPAIRPKYSVLDNTKLPQLRSWQEALGSYLFDKEFILKV